MKARLSKRFLAFILVFALLIPCFVFPASASLETEYATPAVDAELSSTTKSFTADIWGNAYFKIVDGVLYVWGTNNRGVLGITSYVDEDGNTIDVAVGTTVPLPTPIDTNVFDGKVVQVYSDYNSTMVLTENNSIYVWGAVLGGSFGFSAVASYSVPNKIDTSAVTGAIEYIHTSGYLLTLRDSSGNWYVGGKDTYGYIRAAFAPDATTALVPVTMVPDSIYEAIGVDGADDVTLFKAGFSSRLYAITNEGQLYVWSNQPNFAHTNGTGEPNNTAFTTTPANLTAQEECIIQDEETDGTEYQQRPLADAGAKITYIATDDQGNAAIDSDGNVWVWGSNHTNRFGDIANQTADNTGTLQNGAVSETSESGYTWMSFAVPYKLFDSFTMQRKAVKVYLSNNVTVILCSDNTVYAIGANSNGMLSQEADSETGELVSSVTELTQVFENVSLTETIVGVYPTRTNMMALTKAGNMYFVGDNSTGAAGTGDTENATPGETVTISPSTLPPSEPLTANEVYFEIQHGSDKYVMNDDGTVTKNGNTKISANDFVIEAGQNITLNVYFKDFGNIHAFTMPIRFDPDVLQVINGSGVKHSDQVESITPTSLTNSGITQHFTEKTWTGGRLAPGGADETYPKISNADGWVSVMGYSINHNAPIEGTVKMFSIDFTTINMIDKTTTIEFAYDDNCCVTSPLGYGYDYASAGLDGNKSGPFWTLHNEQTLDLVSAFDFNTSVPFPTFSLNVETLTRIELKLYYGSDSNLTEVADTYEGTINDQTYPGNKAINWSNKDIVYTLKVIPTPSAASFPQVDWTYSLQYPLNLLEDYITIIDETDTYIKFKISDSANFADTDPIGLINFTASAKMYQGISAEKYVVAKSFEAPETLRIAEKWDIDTDTVKQEEFIYYSAVDSGIVFNVDYGAESKDEDPNTPQNPQVVWTLLDQYGNEIDLNDPECEVTIGGIDTETYAISLKTHYSTTGNNYLVLRAASLYDSTVYDEVKIKVHLKATSLAFTQETVRMALNSEKELATYLSIMPNDVYETDLVWSIESQPERDPANAPEGATGPFTYAANSGSKIYSYGWATPLIDEASGYDKEEYVVVKVYDNISGMSATVNVSILDLKSPLNIDDIEAVNNLGSNTDVLRINLGLEPGDVIILRYSYGGDIYLTSPALAYAQTPNFTFSVPGLYGGDGGEISVQLKRTVDGQAVEYDEIPISYTAEPSLVHGYARLFGKDVDSSTNEGIRIVLSGTYHSETVFTGEGGYFRFTQYIPPGEYRLTIAKSVYLTRYVTLTIPSAEEFVISSYDYPIYIYPGEIDGQYGIDERDITMFASNWLGQYNPDIPNFDLYDFYETGEPAINILDLELMLMRKGWTSNWYPEWMIPIQ